MNLILDFDDLSVRNTNFWLFEELKEHYPELKVTLFTVPWEIRMGEQTPITDNPEFGQALRDYKDWMEVALHGLTHKQRDESGAKAEFEDITYDEAKKRILIGEKMFINQRIPYTMLFKAPFWLLSKEGKRAAEDLGYTVLEDGYYNWNLKDEKPGKPIKKDGIDWTLGHGHIQITQGNGLEECMHTLMKLPTDTKFYFLSEFYKTKKVDPTKLDFRDPLKQIKITKGGEVW